jgi:hypothetical protein
MIPTEESFRSKLGITLMLHVAGRLREATPIYARMINPN